MELGRTVATAGQNWGRWLAVAIPAVIVGGCGVLLYGIVPLLVRRSQQLKPERELTPTTPEDLNETAREGIRRAALDLGAEGFEVVGNYRGGGSVAGQLTISVLFVHRADGCFAEGAFVSTRSESSYREVWSVVIRTRFDDGNEIATASWPSPSIFPRDRTSDSINPYWLKDGRLLYAIHRSRVARGDRTSHARAVPAAGTEVEFLREERRRELRRVAAAGYYRLDAGTNTYRMTIRGAYLMTWRMLWPLKGLRARASERRTRGVLNELGFGEVGFMPAQGL